jgi:tubulin polyglutamylase TTLL4
LSSDEKLKHQHHLQRMNEPQVMESMLETLTPDDIRILVETEDEYARRGNFVRVFPTPESGKRYLKLFETPRYYNLLLEQWIRKHGCNSDRGLKLLNHYCVKNVHRQNPAVSYENQVFIVGLCACGFVW